MSQFEGLIVKYINLKYAIATSSLYSCFECLNIKNKEVLVSHFTF
jgi:hypothetical protein